VCARAKALLQQHQHLFECVHSLLESLCSTAFAGVLAFAADVGRLDDRHTRDDSNDIFLADESVHVKIVNVEAEFELLLEFRAVKDQEALKELVLREIRIVVLVNDLEDAFCEQPRQLAVVDEGDLVDAFLLVVRTLLQVVEDVLEVGHAHLFLEFVVLHSLCKQ